MFNQVEGLASVAFWVRGIGSAAGLTEFGIMRRKRAPRQWELILAEHFPLLAFWYSRLVKIEPDATETGTMRERFRDLKDLERNKGIAAYTEPLAWLVAAGITAKELGGMTDEVDEPMNS